MDWMGWMDGMVIIGQCNGILREPSVLMCVTGNWLHPRLVVNLFLSPNIFISIWLWQGTCNWKTNIICFHSCTCGNWLHPIKSLGRAPQLLSLRGRHGKSGIGHVGLIISLREYINTSISSTIRHWRGKVPINVSPEALSYIKERRQSYSNEVFCFEKAARYL